MKKSILYLIAAHVLSTVIALLSDGGILTMMVLYIFQAFLLLLIIAVETMLKGGILYKIIILGELFWFCGTVLIAALFLYFMHNDPIIVNGVEKNLNLGKLSIWPVVAGGGLFLIDYIIDAIREHENRLKHELSNGFRVFIMMFGYTAALILILSVAASFEASKLSIVLIAVIKMTLDVGLLVLNAALRKVDLSLNRFMVKKS